MKRKALFIGVNEYEDPQIRDLNYSLSDAHALKTLFELLGYETDILENPVKSDVFSTVRKMTRDLAVGDLFFFYFAGHGWTTTSGRHLLFCKDDMYEDLRDDDAGISFDKLKRKTTGEYNRAFVLDACRSDFITGTRGGDETTRDLRPIGELVKDAPTKSSLAVLRSCSKYEHALEIDSRKHGLFTLAMIDVLRASKESGTELLFGESLCDAVTQKMADIARAEGIAAAQTPEFAKSGIAQVLISGRKVPPSTSPSATAPSLVTCPVCLSNIPPVGTHNCVKCGKKYVCAECWDREHKCCVECAGKMREADKLLEEGKRLKEKKAYSEAAECFRKAADLGNGEACHEYGDMLLYGRGVERDVGVALEFYRKCDDSDGWVQYNIGMCHLHFAKERDVAKEGVEAVAWLKKSAEQGVPWACVKLGECYRDGVGVSQDFSTAASWYPRALEDKGLKTFGDYGAAQWAEFNMGWLCRNGQGVAKDPRVALQWFRRAAARKSDAADPASTAAAEVLPEVLAERVGDKLGKYWQDFRIIHGVQIRDDGGRLVPLAGLVASNRAIFVGVSLESLPANIRNSLPSDNPAKSFAQSISNHCGIPLECFLRALVVPETFCDPDATLPSWAVHESNLADAMLKEKAEVAPDWQGKRQDIIRKLETLPMSSEGAEKNALIHFKADEPEWEYGAALLEKVEKPSSQLIQLARRAAGELDQAGKSSVADNVRTWLEKKGRKAHEDENVKSSESTSRLSRVSRLSRPADECKTIALPGGAEMELVWCPPGEFMMGSQTGEEGRFDNEAQHRVQLTDGFWMGKHPVTQLQWQSVMGSNPSKFRGDDLPVETVSWDDCQDFVARVNAALGCGARLPTEAEWEYACRAGTTTAYSWGNALNGDMANCNGTHPCGTAGKGTYLAETTSVGKYGANPWGLCDMHGNVWEWCADWFDEYPTGSMADPKGPASGDKRVLRGGGWDNYAQYCRSAYRDCDVPSCRYGGYGFRLCCSA